MSQYDAGNLPDLRPGYRTAISTTCPIPLGESGVWNDGIAIRWRMANGSDTVICGGHVIEQDFFLDASATLPLPWGKQDTSAAGAPTIDFVADAAGGEYVLQHANTSEAEAIGINFADQLVFDITKKPVFFARLKIDGTAAAVMPAGSRLVAGLASARNATLDSVTTNAWFRVEGAGAGRAILAEADDGTTDSDDQSTGVSYVEGTYLDLVIDCISLAAVKFVINGVLVKTLAISAATGNVQPFIELQKDSGTGTIKVTIDKVRVVAQ